MKKTFLKIVLVFIILFGAVVSLINFSPTLLSLDNAPATPGDTHYNRQDINCNDPTRPWREKTLCIVGGNQLCDAMYCN